MALVETVVPRTAEDAGPPAARRRAAHLLLLLIASAIALTAHEGHGVPVKPVYQDVAGDDGYRMGFAMQPPDALVGEDIRLEFHLIPPAGSVAPPPERMVVRVAGTGATFMAPRVSPGGRRGTYLVRHRFEDSGPYQVAVRPADAGEPGATFPIVVSPGPVLRAAFVVDAVVILIVGALLGTRLRQSRSLAARRPAAWGGSATVAGVGLVALVVAHVWVSPTLGRLFLPERHSGNVPWEAPQTGAGPSPGAAPSEPSPGQASAR